MPDPATGLITCQPALTAPLFVDPLPLVIPAGGITLLSGAPNVGKTALLAGLCKSFRDGTPIFGHQPNPLPAIGVICADRGWARGAGVWFERAGYPEIRYYSMADDPSFDPRCLRRRFERTQRLAEFVDRLQLPPGSLVVVDPIALFLGGTLNDYDTCAVACHEIRVMLRARGLTLVAAAHSAKLKQDKRERYVRVQDQILGSTAILGFSDTQMYLASPDETGERTYTLAWNSHLAPAEFFTLARTDTGLFVPADTMADLAGSCRRVLALLPEAGPGVPLTIVLALAAQIPLSEKTVRRALDHLIEAHQVEKVRRGVYRRVNPLDQPLPH